MLTSFVFGKSHCARHNTVLCGAFEKSFKMRHDVKIMVAPWKLNYRSSGDGKAAGFGNSGGNMAIAVKATELSDTVISWPDLRELAFQSICLGLSPECFVGSRRVA